MTQLLFVQNDGALLVQSDHPDYDSARGTLLLFAGLKYRMDPIHVYQIRPMTLWQAASLGVSARDILTFLRSHAVHPVPYALQQEIVCETRKWGSLSLQSGSHKKVVLRGQADVLKLISGLKPIQEIAVEIRSDGIVFHERHRAEVKRRLSQNGYPVLDRAGYRKAESLNFRLHSDTSMRPYQSAAVESFFSQIHDQSGVVVLPCGAGKTLVGIGVLSQLQMHALILTPNESSARQWERELTVRTTIASQDVRLYTPGEELAPITITTYQRVSAKTRSGERKHLATLTNHPWGIVVYDEVHMLPAPLFRLAADLQSARRLGLTATLVREDGAETDVFSLIGPKCYDIPWKQLEREGYLASVRCVEVRVQVSTVDRQRYQVGSAREQHKLAAQNRNKTDVVKNIIQRHRGEGILIIGHYIESLEAIAKEIGCPIITGKTPQEERERVLEDFRLCKLNIVALSRVANMAIDLPSASIAIQISGLFGSRQEEAQRLGRLLRPQTAAGVFYTIISENTVEEKMAQHRQLYLVEQGYAYDIVDSGEFESEGMTQHAAVRLS